MLLYKNRNLGGSYGRCSCLTARNFKIGDRVVIVCSYSQPRIGITGTVIEIYASQLTIRCNNGDYSTLKPQRLRKI